MELLPPVGWADVATKHDLVLLETRIDAKLEHELRLMTWRLFSLGIPLMAAMIGALVAVARF
jgi:hypothetical protein